MKRRLTAAFLCLCLLFTLLPVTAFAEGEPDSGMPPAQSALCEHHTQHDESCGYTEGTAEISCSHEHTEDCYTLVTECIHEHTAECYPAEDDAENTATPSDAEEAEPTECTHECSEESGCITKTLDCKHQHDEACGYVPSTEGTRCNFVCEVCNVQDSGDVSTPSDTQLEECICETLCTEEEINADCSVCSAEGAELDKVCVGAAPMLPVTVLAAGEHGSHSNGWTELTADTTTLSGGSYYLSGGVEYTGAKSITVSGEVILCLNGHKLDLKGQHISVGSGASLTLCDCSTGGVLTGGSGGNGGGVYVGGGGTFTLTGGNIAGNTANAGGGVYVDKGGTFTMEDGSINNNKATSGGGGGVMVNLGTFTLSGGSITGNATNSKTYGSGGGVCLYGTFYLSGDSIIQDNTKDGTTDNLYLGWQTINITGPLGENAHIGVTAENVPRSFISGWSNNMVGENPADYFSSDGDACGIGLNANGDVVLGSLCTTITLNPNGGTLPEYSLVAGAALPIPTKTGYTFAGWYENPEFSGNPVTDIPTNNTENLNFYAKWTANTYTVTFDANGGSVSQTSAVTVAGKLTSLPTPTYDGYDFLGWYTDKDGGDEVTINTVFTKDTTIYAHWQKQEYTVTFDANGGSVTTISATTKDGKLESLPTPTYDGYDFLGWYTDKDGGDEVTTNTVFTKDTTIYAHWQKQEYTVTFDSNGGSVTTISATTKDGKLESLPTPIYDGYTFLGWYTQKDSGDKVTTETVFTADSTIYAHWQKESGGGGGSSYDYYTITASAGTGGSISPSGSVSVREGRDKTFTITPAEGYLVADVLVDGVSVKHQLVDRQYTFKDVWKNHTIEASFAWVGAGTNSPFTDVKTSDWFYAAVMDVYQRGVMSGTSSTTFSPYENATRAQLATILWRMAGSPEPRKAAPFTDVPAGAYYEKAVTWCSEQGIVSGYGGGLFGPNDPVTREQAAVFLFNFANYKKFDTSARAVLSGYTDADKISAWALDAVKWANAEGILNGSGDNTLSPQGLATRAQLAAMISNFLARYDKDFILPPSDGDKVNPNTGGGPGNPVQIDHVPQTGDNTPIWPFVALPISTAGLAACTVHNYKRRKEEDEEPDCQMA